MNKNYKFIFRFSGIKRMSDRTFLIPDLDISNHVIDDALHIWNSEGLK